MPRRRRRPDLTPGRTVHLSVMTCGTEFHAAVPASTLCPFTDLLNHKAHAHLVARLSGTPGRKLGIEDGARLAFVVACTHPVWGHDFQRAFNEAMNTFSVVAVSVAVSDAGLGFSVGTGGGVAHELYSRLGQEADGETTEGAWPTFH